MAERTKQELERFYHAAEVGRMLDGMSWNQFHYELLKNPLEVKLYRWRPSSARGTRLYIPESDVNKYREREGLEPLDTPIPEKPFYDRKDVAFILGIKTQNVSLYVRDGILPMQTPDETHVLTNDLRRWYGLGQVKLAGLEDRRYHPISEAAAMLGVEKGEMEALIEEGHLKGYELDDPSSGKIAGVYKRDVMSKRDLLKWIKSREVKATTRMREERVIA